MCVKKVAIILKKKGNDHSKKKTNNYITRYYVFFLQCLNILCTGLFSPDVIFAFLQQLVSPHLEFAQTQMCLRDIMTHFSSLDPKFAR